jgi:predicted alpha/beta-fold hydrolase
MTLHFPAFRPRAPWWGADLQTLRNVLVAPRHGPGIDGRPLKLPVGDGSGDVLTGTLHRRADSRAAPLVVLIHGLSGSEDSAYMSASAAHWIERGFPALRLNLRGAGSSRPLCRQQYHAGRSEDLRDALRALVTEHDTRDFLVVGYSLGANLVLKFLAEYGTELPVRGAATVSAPLDLAAASRRFLARRNRVYHRHLLRSLKEQTLGPGAGLTSAERRAVEAARDLFEFDDHFVAPRNGWSGAPEYYAVNSSEQFLSEIRVPTLLIHARNDPWIPGEVYQGFPWSRSPRLLPLLPDGGGHVGFHGGGSRAAWHDRCIEAFFLELLEHGA